MMYRTFLHIDKIYVFTCTHTYNDVIIHHQPEYFQSQDP